MFRKTFAIAATLIAVAGAPVLAASQLERQTVSPAEFGLFSVSQLSQIKSIKEDPKLTSSEKQRRIEQVKLRAAGAPAAGGAVRVGY